MNVHDKVVNWEPINDPREYLFRIRRIRDGSENDVIVHLTDAYSYGLAEFYVRPNRLGAGSFVVIGVPHASASDEVIEKAKDMRIGIGHIGKFMGALNYRNIWEYMSPDEREWQAAKKRSESEK